jgi:hypothetical protein
MYYQKKEDYSLAERELHTKLFSNIAEWIVYECDTPIKHVEWLLGELEEHWQQQDKHIIHEYADVLELLTKRKGEYNNDNSNDR